MSKIGSADLLIVPKFDGLSRSVDAALGGVDTTGSGRRMGKGVSDGVAGGLAGLAKGGAIAGAFSSVTSKAMDVVAAHVGSAAARLDTLKNYPRVMESLGVGSDEASASITTMSDRLSGLPTRLDEMAGSVQGIYAATKDYGVSLTTATDAGLALNDMLLAGGQGAQVTSAAMEQFRQMLSKGKPEMQDWKSLMSAAPGQMDQLAKSMLGPTANANDLYEALGGGKAEATISMDQLLDAIIDVDQRGGAGLASFKAQAQDATGGIQTAMDNLSNSVTKGIANVMDSFGRDNIAGAINLAKDAVTGLFDVLAAGAGELSDYVRLFGDGAGATQRMTDAIQKASGPIETAAGSFDTLGETVEHAADRARQSEEKARDAHADYLDQLRKSADFVQEAYGSYERQVSGLEYAGQVIDTYAGKTDLSAAQQRELKDAVDTVNSACGTQYAVLDDNSTIIDTETGKVQDNTTEIWENIRAREYMAKADFYGTAKLQADQDAGKAANDFQAQRQAASDASVAVQALVDKYGSLDEVRVRMNATDSNGALTSDAIEIKKVYSGFEQSVQWLREADQAQRQAAQSSRELAAEQEALQAKASGAELSISQIAMTTDVAAQAFNEGGSKARYSIEDFGAALDAASSNKEALKSAMGDPETMARIVAAYDGTAESLGGVLDEIGVGFDETAARAADAAGTVTQMGDWLSGLGDEAYSAFALMGTSSDDLAAKLSQSGVTMEQLNAIGSENFSALAQSCGGNLDELIARVQIYNDVPIIDKDGKVTADTTRLVDAQGNVYTWNGQDLLDKDCVAAAADTTVVDAQGHKVTWNGTDLNTYSTSASVSDPTVPSAARHISDYNSNPPQDFHATTVIDVIHNTFENIIRTVTGQNARGGVVRRHATGAVFTRPTWISPTDIIGEDGPEYYDGTNIVPLTSKYGQPFANLIADGVARRGGLASSPELGEAVSLLRALLDGQNRGAVYIDGDRLVGEIADRVSRGSRAYA